MSILGLPSGVVVKFSCSALASRGLKVQIPGTDLAPLVKPHCGNIPHKIEEEWHGCQLSDNLPQAKEEDWQQMLAQVQSSSPKKQNPKNRKPVYFETEEQELMTCNIRYWHNQNHIIKTFQCWPKSSSEKDCICLSTWYMTKIAS